MAAFAYAVYYDNNYDKHKLPETFNITKTFQRSLGTWNDAFGFIGFDRTKGHIVLAFRGSSTMIQVLQELMHHTLLQMPGMPKGVLVNEFFYNIVNLFLDDILKGLDDVVNLCPDCRLWVTGHSLGGALAALAAFVLTERANLTSMPLVYTFGQPRVGNAAFADLAAQQLRGMFRLVNAADVVAHIPFCDTANSTLSSGTGNLSTATRDDGVCIKTGYYHFGTEIYYPKGDYLNDVMCGYRECVGHPRWEDRTCSDSLFDIRTPPSFADHHSYWDVIDNGFCKKPDRNTILV